MMRESPQKAKRSFKSRLYFIGFKIRFRLISRKQSARWTGFCIGLLDHRDFHAIDDALYEESAIYRSDEHNGRGLFDWEEKCLSGYFPSTGSLLVIGAGGGREVLALAKRGYDVEGYECNLALVEFANEFLVRQGCKGTVSFLDRDCAPIGQNSYDGAIVGWSAYMLIPGRQRRIAFLRALNGQLKEGSPLLLSFFTRAPNVPYLSEVRDKGARIRRLRHKELVELGDDLGPNYIHRFTREEIERELAEAEFSLAFYGPQGAGYYDSGHAVGIKRGTASTK
ncbi:hypothetical protein IAD21_06216 [Abditibacteriota bacterium]|nr:hypothetical protein IAD21_06216 [Abditibacteriota bacterium]